MRRLAVLVALAVVLAGCGQHYNDKRGRGDAGVGEVDGDRKEVIEFPDWFSNVAHGCDGHGHRVYVTTGDAGHVAVIADPSCA
jgi:hypothetical protein